MIMMMCLVLFTAVQFGLKQKIGSEKELQLMLKKETAVWLASSATSVFIFQCVLNLSRESKLLLYILGHQKFLRILKKKMFLTSVLNARALISSGLSPVREDEVVCFTAVLIKGC